ncbi:MAG: glycosyltransferase family 2 protein [Aeromicrobium sp.]
MAELKVTVVVPTRNNERTIEQCLRSVRSQLHPDIELIMVDNFSTDRTPEIGRELADQVLSVGPERSAQRNAGIAAASGEWVMWLDSDLYLTPEAISVSLAAAQAQDADGVALPERTIGEGFWTSCRALERECYVNFLGLQNPRLLKREFMQDEGRFDPRMSGPEDANLRINMEEASMKIIVSDVLIDHDEGRLTLADIFEKRVYYGKSLPTLVKSHPGAVRNQARLLVQAYVQNWRILVRHPVKTPCMFAMRLMEGVGYLVGAGRTQLASRRA